MYYNGTHGSLRADLIKNEIELRLVGETEIQLIKEDIVISEQDCKLGAKT